MDKEEFDSKLRQMLALLKQHNQTVQANMVNENVCRFVAIDMNNLQQETFFVVNGEEVVYTSRYSESSEKNCGRI